MIVPAILFIFSVIGVFAALFAPGWADLALLTVPSALGSLYLLLAGLWRRKGQPARPIPIVIDGSNVMHWKDNTPSLDPLREVLAELRGMGFAPGVVFDANAGYKLAGTYLHDRALGRLLGLKSADVMVVPKGNPADPTILMAAREAGARIVTNDRFRDWVEQFPEAATPGHLIRGGYREGRLWLDVAPVDDRAKAA